MKRAVRACSAAERVVSLVALAVLCLAAQAAEPLHLERARMLVEEGVIGFTPPPARIEAAALAGAWTEIALPFALPRPLKPLAPTIDEASVPTDVRWYRLDVAGAASAADVRYLYLPSWKSEGRIAVYGDGRLLFQSHADVRWNGSMRPLWIALDGTDAPPVREVLVRSQHLPGLGGALSTVWVGDREALYWRYLLREALQVEVPYQSAAAFLAAGLFALFVWLRRRHEILYLLFFCTAVAGYVRTLYYHVGQQRLPIAEPWFSWLMIGSLYWLLTSVHLSLSALHGRRQRWLTLLLLGLTIPVTLVTLPLVPGYLEATRVAAVVAGTLVVTSNLTFLVHLVAARRAGVRDAMLLAGWGLFATQLGAHDWLLHTNRISVEGLLLASYLNVGVFYLFTFIMFRRYLAALGAAERSNVVLAEKLREREAELVESHRKLREVEQQEMLRLERRRMMQDMHDGLGSSLVSALRVVERGELGATDIAEVLKSCIDDLKLTIDSLEPVEADLLLLLATLRFRLAPRLESSGVKLVWDVRDVPPLAWLTPRNSLHILRILQEAFTNIIKHTRAAEIRVATDVAGGAVTVTVSDDGGGFDPAQVRAGRGLANQRSRAASIGGEVRWEATGSGTRFVLSLPIAAAQSRSPPPEAATGPPDARRL